MTPEWLRWIAVGASAVVMIGSAWWLHQRTEQIRRENFRRHVERLKEAETTEA